jgi:hypothetical protein
MGSYSWAFIVAGILLLTGMMITMTLTHAPISPLLGAPARAGQRGGMT